MPEGDTIYRAAAKLRDAIGRQVIRNAETRSQTFPAKSLIGEPLTKIEALGKHLLMHLGDGRVLHSHMGMTGSWHVYQTQQAWTKPSHQAEVVLRFEHADAVCFSPKLIELLAPGELKRHLWLTRLGPDLLADILDMDEAIARFHRHDTSPIGEAVMNQAIVCGIGHVCKSELLFLQQLHPRTYVRDLSDEQLISLITRSTKLLKRNVNGGPRRTRFRGDGITKWVYGRQGEPCLKCGATIQLTRQGDLGRTTYYCPSCQRFGDGLKA